MTKLSCFRRNSSCRTNRAIKIGTGKTSQCARFKCHVGMKNFQASAELVGGRINRMILTRHDTWPFVSMSGVSATRVLGVEFWFRLCRSDSTVKGSIGPICSFGIPVQWYSQRKVVPVRILHVFVHVFWVCLLVSATTALIRGMSVSLFLRSDPNE